MASILPFVIAIIGLGLLVVLHEGGHYLAARWCGMRVERFSIGFGPTLIGFKRGETLFQIAPIPLGGFVQITGLNPHEEFDRKDPYVYPNRPRWMRLFTVIAGPLANFLTAMVVMLLVFTTHGAALPTGKIRVMNVVEGSPAAAAGLKVGDVVKEANGEPAALDQLITKHIRGSGGAPLRLKVVRNDQPADVTVLPKLDNKAYRIGVEFGDREMQRVPLGQAVKLAALYPYDMSAQMLGQLWLMVRGKTEVGLSGPIEITKQIKNAVLRGTWDFVHIIAYLSVMLGIFNLLPLPGLDGGRALFLLIEAAIRRRINPRVEAAVHTVGVVLLLGLLVIVSIKDLGFFGKG